MEGEERDSTQDWLLSAEAAPPLLGELIERIEKALEVAYSSEAAANAIGGVAIDAAEQARAAVKQSLRAAEQAHRSALLAEQASVAMLESPQRRTPAVSRPEMDKDSSMRSFDERADRIVTRLRALERIPLRSPGRADRRSGSDILPGASG